MSTAIISGKDLFMYMNSEDNMIIDIREKRKYIEGHIMGAINLFYDDNDDTYIYRVRLLIEKKKINNIVMYCEHGGTSYKVADLLEDVDGVRLLLLYGGIDAYKGDLERG